MRRRALLLGGCLLAAAWTQQRDLLDRVPQAAAGVQDPIGTDEQAERAGSRLYARECAACHGLNREGHGRAPRLSRAEVREAPPGDLFWILRNGSLRNGMPSFAHLPEPERWQIIAFLRQSAGANPTGARRPNR